MPFERRTFAWCVAAICLARAYCQDPTAPPPAPNSTEPVAHFGTTVVTSSGLRGEVYFIPPQSPKLPEFEKLKPVGTIYTNELNVPRHAFTEGFPGVTDRFEWFAIDYTGKFWIDKPGKYFWALASDDGSKLYIDGHKIIDNDGQHPPTGVAGTAKLKRGEHRLRVSYFQGPRDMVELILAVMPPGEHEFSLFNTEDYLSPAELAEWKRSRPDDPQFSGGVKPRRKPGEEIILTPTIPMH
jgi:hypothetical protein